MTVRLGHASKIALKATVALAVVALVIHRPGAGAWAESRHSDASKGACSDGAYALYSNKWVNTLKWYFNSKSTPSGISESSATTALRDAVKDITQARNDCGLSDRVGATASYQGSADTSVNIGKDGSCKSGDGKSVVGFGDLPKGSLAMTCWWVDGSNHTTEADIRLNKVEYDWTVTVGNGCSSKWSIEGATAHEFGHAFGMAHVGETDHPNLTMSPEISACQSSEATLGLGDLDGLEAKY